MGPHGPIYGPIRAQTGPQPELGPNPDRAKHAVYSRTQKSTAKLNGDITTNKLSIEPGASFTGSCSMGAVIKDMKDVGKKEQKEKTA